MSLIIFSGILLNVIFPTALRLSLDPITTKEYLLMASIMSSLNKPLKSSSQAPNPITVSAPEPLSVFPLI